jgi:hypothetical protein
MGALMHIAVSTDTPIRHVAVRIVKSRWWKRVKKQIWQPNWSKSHQ